MDQIVARRTLIGKDIDWTVDTYKTGSEVYDQKIAPTIEMIYIQLSFPFIGKHGGEGEDRREDDIQCEAGAGVCIRTGLFLGGSGGCQVPGL